jgi:hypothetical protein
MISLLIRLGDDKWEITSLTVRQEIWWSRLVGTIQQQARRKRCGDLSSLAKLKSLGFYVRMLSYVYV